MRTFSRKNSSVIKKREAPSDVSKRSIFDVDDVPKRKKTKTNGTNESVPARVETIIIDDPIVEDKDDIFSFSGVPKQKQTTALPSKLSSGVEKLEKKSPKIVDLPTANTKTVVVPTQRKKFVPPRHISNSQTPTPTMTPTNTPTFTPGSAEADFFFDDFESAMDVSKLKVKSKPSTPTTAPKRKVKSAEELISDGRESAQTDRILDHLNGLNSNSIDIKTSSASGLADMCANKKLDLSVFLRAHGLLSETLSTLTKCSKTDFEKSKKLALLVVQIISFLLHDPSNIDYITDDCFEQLHRAISLNPVLEKSSKHDAKMQRTRRPRNVKADEEDDLIVDRTLSMSLSAMAIIIDHEHRVQEKKKVKQESLFVRTGTFRTIEKLVPCIVAQLSTFTSAERDEILTGAIHNCIKLLELSGVYGKYQEITQETQEAWNALLPALVQLLPYLSNLPREPLYDINEKHTIIRCILSVLKFLVNVTNHNKDACNRVALEGGIDATVQVLRSNLESDDMTGHFDVLNMCLGLLINMTEKDEANRELLAKQTIGKKRFIPFLTSLFDQLCANWNSQDSQEVEINNKKNSKNVEEKIVASYLAILIGCIVKEHEKNRKEALKGREEEGFKSIVNVLKGFLVFQSSAKLLTETLLTSIRGIIDDLMPSDK